MDNFLANYCIHIIKYNNFTFDLKAINVVDENRLLSRNPIYIAIDNNIFYCKFMETYVNIVNQKNQSS